MRLINTATARIFPLNVAGIDGRIVALDGMPLISPVPITDLVMAPAQRIDIIATVTDAVSITIPTGEGWYELGLIALDGVNPRPIETAISALPVTATAMPAPNPDQTLTLTLQGGAMGGRHAGNDIWALNGQSNLAVDPFASFARGQTARITLVNETPFPHGIHLHGHHFHEVGPDGALGPLRDTTLVDVRQSRDIICVFDNPGQWLFHCHMLGHQAAGMKTWVEVA